MQKFVSLLAQRDGHCKKGDRMGWVQFLFFFVGGLPGMRVTKCQWVHWAKRGGFYNIMFFLFSSAVFLLCIKFGREKACKK